MTSVRLCRWLINCCLVLLVLQLMWQSSLFINHREVTWLHVPNLTKVVQFDVISVPGSKEETRQTGLAFTDTLHSINKYNETQPQSVALRQENSSLQGIAGQRSVKLENGPKEQLRKTFEIVWYRPYHGGLKYHATKASKSMSKCPYYNNCRISFTSTTAGNVAGDAVLFQGNHMPWVLPRRSSPRQAFVFVNVEAPQYLHITSLQKPVFTHFFNWTMTYRLGSDIRYTYGAIKKRTPIGPARNYSQIFRKKTNMAAWFVSHCETASRREDYVRHLSAHAQVHIYGRCGSLHTCPKNSHRDCDMEVAGKYKFYLAFENSLCDDYITEKAYSWFSRDIILVVRGAGNYSKYLPQGTYIDASDFKSPRELGLFLTRLGNNEAEYVNYLKRKDQYSVVQATQTHHNAFCKLCDFLNNRDKHRKSYPSIHQWWRGTACHTPTDIV